MKKLTSCIAAMALLLGSVAAYAGEKQSINFNLYQDSKVGAVKLPAGEYKMLLDREGDTVKFSLLKAGKTVLSSDARFSAQSSFSAPVAVVTGAGGELTEIQVAKLKGAIVLDSASHAPAGSK